MGKPLGSIKVGGLYQASRPTSLRSLALAVVKPRWAADAPFLARFAREAYASEQLSHPNLLVATDLDIDRGWPFAALDLLATTPLSDPTRGRSGLDRSGRAAAILHAARGLKHAHEQGVYHRDINLDKIRIDPRGLVQLAEVGLALTPETPFDPAEPPVPVPGVAPPPPAPEAPAASAAREDVTALGRALQTLIGGSLGERAVPPGLANVARRMIGEAQEPRYLDLGAAIRALEGELGVAGPFTPRDEEAAEFEASAADFHQSQFARVRPLVALGTLAILALFVGLLLLAGRPLPALGFLSFGGLIAVALVTFRGLTGRDPLFDRAVDLVVGGTRNDRLTVLAVVVLGLVALVVSGLLWSWLFLASLAVGLAAACHYAIDRPLLQSRLDAINRASGLIRGLRGLGIDEESVRRFACRQGGRRWEEFFEVLFGYPALRQARTRWGNDAGGQRRPRFAFWRDPIIDAIDARLASRARDRDRVLFQRVEERALEAKGVNLLTARRKSQRMALAIVQFAHQFRTIGHEAFGGPLMEALNRVAARPDDYLSTSSFTEDDAEPVALVILAAIVRVLFGPRTRFLAGGVLLAGSLLWMSQNALITAEGARQIGGEIQAAGAEATTDHDKALADARKVGQKIADNARVFADAAQNTRPLKLSGLPPALARRVDGLGLGVAGLILLISACYRGVRFAAFALPAALIAALGPHLIDQAARPLGFTSLVAMGVGGGLLALGVLFGRSRD